jgi:hypothetical protein
LVSEAACRDRQKEGRVLELCGDCCRYATVRKTVRRTVGESWKHSELQSDNNSFPGGQIGTGRWLLKAMDAVERRTISSRRMLQGIKSSEIRARMDELALRMQQNAKSRWVYEWPMKMKVKWPVRELMAKRQQRLLKIWLRHAENLNRPEEKMVQVCEPEDGRNLSSEDDMGSLKISKTAKRAEQNSQLPGGQ